ncbi:MAG: hypothetical protein H6943_00070 [Zoogloeaceae bacterium]|nr:hypothetical protein [Zoogloeaceae bacterium]
MDDYRQTGPCRFVVDEGEWLDATRNRSLRWTSLHPLAEPAAPLIIYSHGLGGSRDSGLAWRRHWASWGIASLALQHPGTDREALPGGSPLALRHLLRTAVDKAQLAARQHDLLFALEQLAYQQPDRRIGIAGHSYGAVSALRLIGERRGDNDLPADPRIAAALLLSPSARGGSLPLDERFADVAMPCLHLTGSADDGIGRGDIDASERCLPFRHSRHTGQYLLVLANARHTDLAGDSMHASPRLQPLLQAASTAFWRAHLLDDRQALNCLCSKLPNQLIPADHFEQRPVQSH